MVDHDNSSAITSPKLVGNVVYLPPRLPTQTAAIAPHTSNSQPTELPVKPSKIAQLPQRLLQWLLRISKTELAINADLENPEKLVWSLVQDRFMASQDDWQQITLLSGLSAAELQAAQCPLPLTAAEIQFFQRDHGPRRSVWPDWPHTEAQELPRSLQSLYEIYLSQCRHDVEATLALAQATGSTRVPRLMADLLAIGGFMLADRAVQHLTNVYAVSAAFDTALLIDRANHEAAFRLALPIEHEAHLLKLTPDDLGGLADTLVEQLALTLPQFLAKAQALAEARQDVNRFERAQQFSQAVAEGDLVISQLWVQRICAAFGRIILPWVVTMPELAMIAENRQPQQA